MYEKRYNLGAYARNYRTPWNGIPVVVWLLLFEPVKKTLQSHMRKKQTMKYNNFIILIGLALATAACPAFGGETKPQEKKHILLGFGDSTTAPRGSLRVYLNCLKNDLFEKGMNVKVVNAGVRGNTTQAARERFQKDVLDRKPDIVIIQFGINDAAVDVWKTPPAKESRVAIDIYQSNLKYFIKTLRAQQSKVVLMTPNPTRWTPALKKGYGKPPYNPNDPDGFNVILKNYAACVRKVERSKNVPLVDIFAVFQAYGAKDGQQVNDLLLDGMHPNKAGHRLIADLLIKELLYPAHPSATQ
jgi:lysophospholipase L1-like esterase